jgi:hypothetical protein
MRRVLVISHLFLVVLNRLLVERCMYDDDDYAMLETLSRILRLVSCLHVIVMTSPQYILTRNTTR